MSDAERHGRIGWSVTPPRHRHHRYVAAPISPCREDVHVGSKPQGQGILRPRAGPSVLAWRTRGRTTWARVAVCWLRHAFIAGPKGNLARRDPPEGWRSWAGGAAVSGDLPPRII